MKAKKPSFKMEQKKETASEELRFSDIDEPLRQYFIKTFLFLGLGTFIIISIAIFFHNISAMSLIFVCIAMYALYLLYLIYKCLNNEMYMYTGKCIEVHYKSKKNLLDTNYIIFQLDDRSLVRANINSKKQMNARNYDMVRCYSTCQELPQLDASTYVVPSVIYICVLPQYMHAVPEEKVIDKEEMEK